MNGKTRGHMLLVAIVLVSLISISLSMAITPIQTATTRQKERELMYRGEHLADGIRRFYLSNGRFPFELDELIENQPRYVRQLYADPMTKDGEWTLVYLLPTDRAAVRGLSKYTRRLLGEEETEKTSENDDRPGLSQNPDSIFKINDQQITGIRSRSSEEGLALRNDSRIYSDWLFSALPQKEINLDDITKKLLKER